MTLANLEPELLTNPTAVLATNGHDGHPQLTAVWYIVEGGGALASGARRAWCDSMWAHFEIPSEIPAETGTTM